MNASHQIIDALITASDAYDGKLPELFSGLSSSDFPVPVDYPTSCSPQAWAAATPVFLVTTLLGICPHAPRRQLTVEALLPPSISRLTVRQVRVGDAMISVDASSDGCTVDVSENCDLEIRNIEPKL